MSSCSVPLQAAIVTSVDPLKLPGGVIGPTFAEFTVPHWVVYWPEALTLLLVEVPGENEPITGSERLLWSPLSVHFAKTCTTKVPVWVDWPFNPTPPRNLIRRYQPPPSVVPLTVSLTATLPTTS